MSAHVDADSQPPYTSALGCRPALARKVWSIRSGSRLRRYSSVLRLAIRKGPSRSSTSPRAKGLAARGTGDDGRPAGCMEGEIGPEAAKSLRLAAASPTLPIPLRRSRRETRVPFISWRNLSIDSSYAAVRALAHQLIYFVTCPDVDGEPLYLAL